MELKICLRVFQLHVPYFTVSAVDPAKDLNALKHKWPWHKSPRDYLSCSVASYNIPYLTLQHQYPGIERRNQADYNLITLL